MSPPRRVALRPEVMVEPLFNHWLALPHLIPPVQAAMVLANRHLPILRSFVDLPRAHAEAMKNPKLVGGPFLNLQEDRVEEVKALVTSTLRDFEGLLALDRAVKALEKTLAGVTGGESLEALYPQVPEPLRGYVELVHDARHRPSARLIERALYRSPHFREDAQSISLQRVDRDSRPFALSTPRLPSLADAGGTFSLRRPFRHPGVALLAHSRFEGVEEDALHQALGLSPEEARGLAPFLTPEPPPPATRYAGEGLRVRYFGHACVLLETKEVSVLTDPLISYDYPTGLPRFTFRDLPPRIDCVLITHAHADHLSFETLLQLKSRVGQVVVPRSNGGGLFDPSLKLMLEALGFPDVRELDELEQLELPGGKVTGLPFLGEHADLAIRSKLAYAVTLAGRTVALTADSNGLEPRIYAPVRELLGPVDALFMGMESEGAPMSFQYGAFFTVPPSRKVDQARRLNGANAARGLAIVEALSPARVYHYAMGLEPWLCHVMGLAYSEDAPQLRESDALLAECRARGLHAERPFARLELAFP